MSSSRQRARSVLPLHLFLYFQRWVQAPRLLPGLPLCPSRASVWSSKKTADQAPTVPWRFPAPSCGQAVGKMPPLGKGCGVALGGRRQQLRQDLRSKNSRRAPCRLCGVCGLWARLCRQHLASPWLPAHWPFPVLRNFLSVWSKPSRPSCYCEGTGAGLGESVHILFLKKIYF